MIDDDLWLTHKWWMLRNAVQPMLREHVGDIVAEVIAEGRIGDDGWKAFMAAMLKALSGGIASRPALFGAALDLFANPKPLRNAIEEGGAKLNPDFHVKLKAHEREKMAQGVLNKALNRGLVRIRDIRLGGTAYKGKVWARLDNISRLIANDKAETTGYPVDRCSMDHFIDVLSNIRERHAGDHNIAKSIKTIEEYFAEFCDECQPIATDLDAITENPAELIRMLPDSEYVAVDLMHCLDELEGQDEQTAEFVRFKFELGGPNEDSVSDFCDRMKIERTRFRRIVKRGLEMLKLCLNGRNATRFGSPDLGYRSSGQDL